MIGLAASVIASAVALHKLRIGGAGYENIIAGKDLVADILPPPEYVIEAYLEAQLAMRQPEDLRLHAGRLAQLKKDYFERRDFWAKSDALPTDLRDALTKESDAHVQKFWAILESAFLPALEMGKREVAASALESLGAAYAQHRTVIDRVVAKANDFSAKAEEGAAKESVVFQALMFGVSGLVFLIAGIGAHLMRRKVSAPLRGLTSYVQQLAAGRHDLAVPYRERCDEIGEMARSVEVFRAALIEREQQESRRHEAEQRSREERQLAEREAIRMERELVSNSIGAAVSRLAAKDVTSRISEDLPEAYGRLQGEFNGALAQLGAALSSVAAGAKAIRHATHEVAAAANDLSKRTEQQAANLGETAAAIREITATVGKTAQGAQRVSEVVSMARSDAERSGEVVREAVEAMGQIETSSQNIGQIIGVIDEIAFQTNLLALNAGVEAARAGEAGKGFAVVASEVRALAQRSAEAAKEIKKLISLSNAEIEGGVGLVLETGKALRRIEAQVAEINELIAEMASGALGQATTLQQINAAIEQIDQDTQKNAAMVQETSAATDRLRAETEDLVHSVQDFKIAERGGAASDVERKASRRGVVALKNIAGAGKGGAVRRQAPDVEEGAWLDF